MNDVNVLGKGELQDELENLKYQSRVEDGIGDWRGGQWVIASDTPDVILIGCFFQTVLIFEHITYISYAQRIRQACHWLTF